MKKGILFIYILILLLVGSFNFASASSNDPISTDAETDWNFIVLGDGRQDVGEWEPERTHYSNDNTSNPIREALIDKVIIDHSDLEFILHTGDIVKSGAEQDEWDRYYEDIDNIVENNISIYYVVGNHEYYRYALGDRVYAPQQDDLATYRANVEMPGNERFYSYDYKDKIHFVIINTNEDMNGNFQISDEQKDWLINDLSTNTIDLVVAAYHHPSYSIRSSSRVITARSVRAALDPIFIEYDVDLVFNGHDHYYYRTQRNNIMYVTTGGAGSPLYDDGDRSEWQDGDVYFANYHYIEVTVTTDNLDISVYQFNEVDNSTIVADNFQIPYTGLVASNSVSTTSSTTTQTSDSSDTSFLNNPIWLIGIVAMSLFEKLRKMKRNQI